MSNTSLTQAKIKAYDTTSYSRDYTSFFDLNEYNRTYELCNEHTVGYHSGNVIKFFEYNLKDPFTIGNRDGYMSKKLDKMRAEMNVVAEQTSDGTISTDADYNSDTNSEDAGITDEEAFALLGDGLSQEDFITDDDTFFDTEEYNE